MQNRHAGGNAESAWRDLSDLSGWSRLRGGLDRERHRDREERASTTASSECRRCLRSASMRSLMLMRPSPVPAAASTSNPTPSSEIVSARTFDSPRRSTVTVRARLYFSAFCSASCTTRNRDKRQIEGQIRRDTLVGERDRRVGPGKLALEGLKRGRRGRSAAASSDADDARGRARSWQCPAPGSARRRQAVLCRGGTAPSSSSRSIESKATCWLISSCSSRAMRERSVSWAWSSRAPRSRMRS